MLKYSQNTVNLPVASQLCSETQARLFEFRAIARLLSGHMGELVTDRGHVGKFGLARAQVMAHL